ncbi:hypothetical protein [Paenibacillus sp. UNC451MF]|uniref:hypothetical protein n=1 Tax=Paenibacillus sp. UNC451MF TaxID=1449063 RepID=UPI00048B459B|nr:hypothetical protein [Paenibacillus sp. UNC451MF]
MAVSFIAYGILFWLGLYISNRDTRNVRLLLCGISLILSALGIGASLVLSITESSITLLIGLIPALFLCLSFAAWLITVIWGYFSNQDEVQQPSYKWNKLSGIGRITSVLPLLFVVVNVVADSLHWWNYAHTWVIASFGATLALFGIHRLIKEVEAQGEAWLPDFLRSFDYSVIFTALFSGQVAVVILLGTGWSIVTVMLLLLSIVVSIAFQVYVYPVRALLDRIAFATFPKLREDRARLRLVEDVQVRVDDQAEPEEMDEEELYRHTRRALSQFGDLQRIAASPLTQLKLIDRRLQQRGAEDEVVERAIELKAVLLESVGQLKPRQDESFGTADEWRHYNALYFPYIIGIKPYSLRYSPDKLDPSSLEAFEWFRTYIPERTYYNWQNAGAKLVALMLKEKNAS